jgi:hypothetical protein
MATANAKRLLDSLNHSFQQFQDRMRNPPPPPPEFPDSGNNDFNPQEGDWPPGL